MLLALGIVVAQITRADARALFATTLVVRFVILVGMVALFLAYGDPMLVVLSGIVGLGFLTTLAFYIAHRSRA